MKQRIYLDNSATTQVDKSVLEAMLPCFRENFGNASSVHIFGQEARAAVEGARHSIAELLGADTREIVFTSGGTESDNSALWGVFRSGYRPGNHIIATKIEHPAILETCKSLQNAGAEITYVPVDSSGRVDPSAIAAAIREITAGEGVDASLEMSGNPTALHQAFSAVKNGGRVTLFGIPTGPINCDLANEIIFKGIRVYGITGRRLFKTWYRLAGLFQAGLNIKPVITHTFPMKDFARGFELINSGQCGKVVLIP